MPWSRLAHRRRPFRGRCQRALREASRSALCIGPPAADQSYLNQAAILFAAKVSGAQAIHPGTGFLSENAGFAARVEEAGPVFVGPSAACIRTMGDKVAAKRAMRRAGVPVCPDLMSRFPMIRPKSERSLTTSATLSSSRQQVAVAGAACALSKIRKLARNARTHKEEARRAFGNPEVYIEKFLSHPTAVESR